MVIIEFSIYLLCVLDILVYSRIKNSPYIIPIFIQLGQRVLIDYANGSYITFHLFMCELVQTKIWYKQLVILFVYLVVFGVQIASSSPYILPTVTFIVGIVLFSYKVIKKDSFLIKWKISFFLISCVYDIVTLFFNRVDLVTIWTELTFTKPLVLWFIYSILYLVFICFSYVIMGMLTQRINTFFFQMMITFSLSLLYSILFYISTVGNVHSFPWTNFSPILYANMTYIFIFDEDDQNDPNELISLHNTL